LAPLAPLHADDLTRQIQTDLKALGYYTGPVDGEPNMATQLAIGKFEKANGMPVTGKASFPLAVEISGKAGAPGGATPQAPAKSPDEIKAEARQACLKQKSEQAATKQKSKRIWNSLSNVGQRVAGRMGAHDVARDINTINASVYDASEVASVAKEFGISDEDARDCLSR
jgi:peptidoglycan hydrolase-like protein with peptidoglycan-binding domain